jgi:hypothetical protein
MNRRWPGKAIAGTARLSAREHDTCSGSCLSPKCGRQDVAERDLRDAAAERVAETVRRALLLVGPAEHSVELPADELPAEIPAD